MLGQGFVARITIYSYAVISVVESYHFVGNVGRINCINCVFKSAIGLINYFAVARIRKLDVRIGKDKFGHY